MPRGRRPEQSSGVDCTQVSEDPSDIVNWAAIIGVWDCSGGHRLYKSPEKPEWPYGVCVSNVLFSEGTARATICFAKLDKDPCARLLFGFRSLEQPYLGIGLGGASHAYSAYQFDSEWGWRAVALAGSLKNLIAGHRYKVSVRVEGQRALLEVDGVQVLPLLETPLREGQLALFAWGTSSVEFTDTTVSLKRSTGAAETMGFDPVGVRELFPTGTASAPTATQTEQAGAPLSSRSPANKGGRPRKEWWDSLWVEMARQLYAGDLQPKKQADIEKSMADWVSAQGQEASVRIIRDAARKLWNAVSQ
jgi:hypothetical protein